MGGEADVVIIGGGILGSCIALELTRAGLRPVVVEKTGVGLGSTAESSACVRQGYGTREAILLARDSLRAWEAWTDYAEVRAGAPAAVFHRAGAVYLSPDAAVATGEAALMRSCGVPAAAWTPEDVRRRWPDWDLEGVAGAVWEEDVGYVDGPDLAARNSMDAAILRGARLIIDRVVGVDRVGNRLVGVRLASGGRLPCGAAVNAAGPWAASVNRLAGVTMPLRPVRQRTIQAPVVAGGADDLPVIADLAARIYTRPEPGQGGILVGSLDDDADGQSCPAPDANDPSVDRPYYEAKCLAAAKRMPDRVLFPPWTRGLAGLYDVHEPDWYPVFDRTDVEGFFVAAGTSGAWFKGGPSIGALVAHLVTGRRGPLALPRTRDVLDPAFFRRDRPPIRSAFAGGVVG